MRRAFLLSLGVAFAAFVCWVAADWLHDTFHLGWVASWAVAPVVAALGGVLALIESKQNKYGGKS